MHIEDSIMIATDSAHRNMKKKMMDEWNDMIAKRPWSNPITTKTTYTYGNAASTMTIGTSRNTEVKSGATFGLGARAFIGAEYFIFPKMAIGGEFGWGLALSTTGEGQTVSESWDGTKTTQTTVKTGKSSSFIIDTDNNNSMFGPAAAIHLSLHF